MTEYFEDVGHSDEARELLPDMCIGDIEETEVRSLISLSSITSSDASNATTLSNSSL